MQRVRPATFRDAVAAIATVRESIEHLCEPDHRNDPATLERWLANKQPACFETWLANPENCCVVAEVDGAVRGVGLLHRSGELRLFYIAPGHQRSGLGREIHAALEALAPAWGLSRLHLQSTSVARAFYAALGYRPAGAVRPLFGVLRAYPYEKRIRIGATLGDSSPDD